MVSNLTAQSDGTLAGTLTITAAHSTTYSLEPAARAFKKENPSVDIIINKTSNFSGSASDRLHQITEAIMAGNGDDIIDTSFLNAYQFADMDLLTNFYTLMGDDESFSTDDYYVSVFDMMEYNGGLYAFPLSSHHKLVTINKNAPDFIVAQFLEYEQISYREMLDLYQQMLPVRSDLFSHTNFDPQEALANEYGRFIDSAKRVCYFTDEPFISLMQTLKDIYGWRNPEQKDYRTSQNYFLPETTESLKYLFRTTDLSDMQPFFPYEENDYIYPVPLTSDAGNAIAESYYEYIIPSSSVNQALAWEFIKYLASCEWTKSSVYYTLFHDIDTNRSFFRSANESYLNQFIEVSLPRNYTLPNNVI